MSLLSTALKQIIVGTSVGESGVLALNAKSENEMASFPKEVEAQLQPYAERLAEAELELQAAVNIRRRDLDRIISNDRRASRDLANRLTHTLTTEDIEVLGSLRYAVSVDRLPIIRRCLEVLCTRPAITKAETPFLYYSLLALPNGDSLIRENHGWGFHFHYSDDGIRRADILLTFSRDVKVSKKPVTWEQHAIKKADFKARVSKWGSGKRQSVHTACMKDLSKRNMSDYVEPGKAAVPLLK